MKKILFICREELTDLFVELGARLKDIFQVEYIAYNEKDAAHIKRLGVVPCAVFSDLLHPYCGATPSPEQLKEMDEFILRWSDGRFSLNSALQSDRTYTGMNYPDALSNIWGCYSVWKTFFTGRHVAYVFHEPVSLAFNQMAELRCKAEGGRYLTLVGTEGPYRYNYLMLDAGNADCPELRWHLKAIEAGEETVDQEALKTYLDKFQKTFQVLGICGRTPDASYAKLLLHAAGHWGKQHLLPEKSSRSEDSINYFLRRANNHWNRFCNKWSYARKLVYDKPQEGDDYYYYSFHTEPEAVVLYWGDGFYTNQIKLIENIAGQLPPGRFLYVKDHPHILYARRVEDYLRLKRVPNIKLLSPETSGKRLIRNARGVLSINATAGFEALLMRKEVYIFGNAFYRVCPVINKIYNIRDLRKSLYEATPWNEEKEKMLLRFLAGFLKSAHEGVTCFFSGMAQKHPIDQKKNFDNIANDIIHFDQMAEKMEMHS